MSVCGVEIKMNTVLDHSSAIEKYFELISAIPRESGNEKAISEFVVEFAKKRMLSVTSDAFWNVIIKKPASKGCEAYEPVILQAHMDMVCERRADSTHDFTKDPIELRLKDGILRAKDTTLGADDGFGVAYMLAILDDDGLRHPPLECIFTTQEESGNDGARSLDKSGLKARRMIGLDGDQEKNCFVACYCSDSVELEHEYEKCCKKGIMTELTLDGFDKGSYQGVIHAECANVIKIFSRLLLAAENAGIEFNIAKWECGSGENFNPLKGKLKIVISGDKQDAFESTVRAELENLQNEFEDDSYRGCLTIAYEGEIKNYDDLMSESESMQLVRLIHILPNNLVQDKSISNIGMIAVKNGLAKINMSCRSRFDSSERDVLRLCRDAAELSNYSIKTAVRYSPWPYRKDSALRRLANNAMSELYGYTMTEEICPGGLEVVWFCRDMPQLDVLMLGPDIKYQHTPKEQMDMASFHRMYKLLCTMLERMR